MAFEGVEVLLDEADARGEPPGGVAGDRVRREALVHQRLVDEGDGAAPAEAEHEVPVLDRGGLLVEAAELEDDVAAHDEGLGRDHVGEEQRREDVALGRDDRRVRDVAQPQPLAGAGRRGRRGSAGRSRRRRRRPRGRGAAPSASRAWSAAIRRRCPGRRPSRRGPRRRRGCGRRRRPRCAGSGSAAAAGPRPRRRRRACRRSSRRRRRGARSRSRSGAARSRWRRGSRRRGCRPG